MALNSSTWLVNPAHVGMALGLVLGGPANLIKSMVVEASGIGEKIEEIKQPIITDITAKLQNTDSDTVDFILGNKEQIKSSGNEAAQQLADQLQWSKDGVGVIADIVLGAGGGAVVGKVVKGKEEGKIADNQQSSSQELSTIHADAGSKGNWNPVLNKTIQPNTRYELSNGHTYMTDNIGRVNQVEGKINLTTMDRNTYQQNCAGKCVNATGDDGGHLIASLLGGSGDKINLVPQASKLNRGDWKAMERQLANELKAGKAVSVKIDVSYPNSSSVRPNEFNVTAVIDGVKKTWEFDQ